MNHSSSPLDLKANIAKARKLLDSGAAVSGLHATPQDDQVAGKAAQPFREVFQMIPAFCEQNG